jgi:hypothetical protein
MAHCITDCIPTDLQTFQIEQFRCNTVVMWEKTDNQKGLKSIYFKLQLSLGVSGMRKRSGSISSKSECTSTLLYNSELP